MNCTGTSFTMAARPRRMAQHGCTTATLTAVDRAFPAAAIRCAMLVVCLGKGNLGNPRGAQEGGGAPRAE